MLYVEMLEDRCVPALVVPALSSLAGAPISVYLDFDGDHQRTWGTYRGISTPSYSLDADHGNYSLVEQAEMQKIWLSVADDYSPFNVNVTTVKPKRNFVTVVIGGSSDWTGQQVGGLAYVNGYFDKKLPNVGFAFQTQLQDNSQFIADAASHEAGHMFGLRHQSLWSGGTLLATYRHGPGDGTGPLMGYSYDAERSLWWHGQTNGAYIADEFQTLSNVLGLRTDERDGALTASVGVIGTMDDVDRYTVTGDTIAFTLQTYGNLDALVNVYDDAGNLVASGLSVHMSVAYGTYTVEVSSSGVSAGSTADSYGYNVGRYSL